MKAYRLNFWGFPKNERMLFGIVGRRNAALNLRPEGAKSFRNNGHKLRLAPFGG